MQGVIMKSKAACLLLVLSLFVVGSDGNGQEQGERDELLEQQKVLKEKIETLRREQDFLLFEKALYATDSKYLIINLGAKKGQLKYKNRVLKDFRFTASANIAKDALKTGALTGELTLTKKIENPGQRRVLLFGKSLAIQWLRPARSSYTANIPRLSLSKRDFQSIFYAVEEGAKAYIVR
jgi:hypothetical protein